MRLIADSGSTKTHWVIISKDNKTQSLFSQGINPYFLETSSIIEIVSECFHEFKVEQITEVYFYGAGCALPDKCTLVQNALSAVFKNAEITTNSDLLASAHALFGNKSGVACILGTGSNAAVFEANNFTNKIQSVGYLLGDEGSGSYIGKQILQAYLRKEMPKELKYEFEVSYNLNVPDILNSVYKEAFPNRYLAGFASFASVFPQHEFIRSIIRKSFKDFIKYQLKTLKFELGLDVGFVGSIAFYFQDILMEELIKSDFNSVIIIKEPIHNLVEYHQYKL